MRTMPKPITQETVGSLLLSFRKARGINRQVASDGSGVSFEHWGNIERGQEFPKATTIALMREALELVPGEWTALLSRYLIESGLIPDDPAAVIKKAVGAKDREERQAANKINAFTDWLARLCQDDLDTVCRLPGFLEQNPAFLVFLDGFMRFSPVASRS